MKCFGILKYSKLEIICYSEKEIYPTYHSFLEYSVFYVGPKCSCTILYIDNYKKFVELRRRKHQEMRFYQSLRSTLYHFSNDN